MSRGDERGAAVVDFVLILMVFLPIVLGVIQLALFLHVRNTLVACAQEGARKAANYDAVLADGVERTNSCVRGALNDSFAQDIQPQVVGEPAVVEMRINAVMPPLGIFTGAEDGRLVGISFTVSGHAIDEPGPQS